MQLKNVSFSTWSLFLGYATLLLYFALFDMYHLHFFSTGTVVLIYHIYRISFIFYLLWMLYFTGDFFLTHFIHIKAKPCKSYTIDSTLLAFLCGTSIAYFILLLLGFLGLYNKYLLVTITLLIFCCSLNSLEAMIKILPKYYKAAYWPGWTLVLLVASGFILVKGLYPAGGHDYYNHYFPFYYRVIKSGNILPNEVWYHFYYSKGSGLFFLSMFLTDPLAPQLVTTAMIFMGAMIVFSILNKSASWRILPWLGAVLYITCLIYTPGNQENMLQGGWGDIEKQHEPAAVLMLGILWLTIGLAKNLHLKTWGITLLLCACALVIISPTMSVFAGVYLSLTVIFFYYLGNRRACEWLLGGVAMVGLTLSSLFAINYMLTGIPDDQTLFLFWPLINFAKVQQWGVSFELFLLHWNKTGLINSQLPISINLIYKIITYLRLDLWYLWLTFTVTVVSVSVIWKKTRYAILKNLDKISLSICAGFLLITFFLSLVIGRDQPISFFRFTSFTYAPTLCCCLLLLSAISSAKIFGASTKMLELLIIVLVSHTFLHLFNGNTRAIFTNAVNFARGKYSIANAYRHQEGWPGRMPWGGIYPAAEVVWSQVAPNTRVWSMHVHSYCMLPDCRFESYLSYRFSPHAALIYFGSPKQAKLLLQQESLNYFFFSNTLELTDPLPLAPLFHPTNISHYLGIAWTDGDNTLLTWKEDAQFSIDSVWLARYNQRINSSSFIKDFPYTLIRSALNADQNGRRIRSADLPWIKSS